MNVWNWLSVTMACVSVTCCIIVRRMLLKDRKSRESLYSACPKCEGPRWQNEDGTYDGCFTKGCPNLRKGAYVSEGVVAFKLTKGDKDGNKDQTVR